MTRLGPRGPGAGEMFFWGVLMILVPWALFTVALLSGRVTGDHDPVFVVVSLIYGLITTPVGICALWAAKPDTGYWPGDDNIGNGC
jgi:hypothetical protein